MPRLSLYKPEKGPDFRFIDRVVNEQFQVGGTDVFIHRYLGPVASTGTNITPTTPANTATNAIAELGIQDVLFMENRDRNYDPDVYVIRGIYQMQDFDFNLSQFGMFLQNDTIMLHFHLRSIVDCLTRKIMAGDVIELPHLKDEYAMDDNYVALRRFYVVQDVSRPTNGFSQTWYPHLLKAKCTPLVDSQEFSQILDKDSGNGDGSTLRDLLSTYNQTIAISDQIVEQANLDAPLSGYDTYSYFILPTKTSGLVDTLDTSNVIDDITMDSIDCSIILQTPTNNLYVAYGSGTDAPPNSIPFNMGNSFPNDPAEGLFYLRTDYMPHALYRYNGKNWKLYQKGVRMTMNQFGSEDVASGPFAGQQIRQNQISTFVNNNNTATINGSVVQERQALSKALKPRADN